MFFYNYIYISNQHQARWANLWRTNEKISSINYYVRLQRG